jgi:transcriptional regulator GlxA family with amidase domain
MIKPLDNGNAVTTARRAQAFIEDKYKSTIHLTDLCIRTGVGLRTLQRCFALHFQMSPLEYIKVHRLNESRRALVNAEPSVCTVAQIARNKGFRHLGRFSVEYRAHFGESPSETLAARKP